MEKLAIIGGGMSGLVGAYAFSRFRGVEVTVYEPGPPAAAFMAGGLKYLVRTDDMVEMLHDVGIVFTNHVVAGGILIAGKVHPFPKYLQDVDQESARRIQADHYRKTRRTQPDEFTARSMNDPEASGPKKSLRCDLAELANKLAARTNIVRHPVTKVEPGRLCLANGESARYDYLVSTIPIWVLKRIGYFPLPDAIAIKLNIVSVEPLRDPFVKWDYVYTPYTPENMIHRLSPNDSWYDCEFNGNWTEDQDDALRSELNFLFPSGWFLHKSRKGLNGHLLPLAEKPSYPANVRPLGRFAKWDPRATTDVTFRDANGIAKEWGWTSST